MPRLPPFSIQVAAWVAGGLLGGISWASAATISWANSGTDFSLGSSWTGGTAPANSLTTDIASFGSAAPAFQPNLAVNRSIAGIQFISGAGAFTFSGLGTLSLGASGIVNGAVTSQTLTVPLKLGTATAFRTTNTGGLLINGTVNTNAFTLTLNGDSVGVGVVGGIVSGTGGITKSGAGVWMLSGANTYSGGTTLSAGTLFVGNDTALGSGALTITGATSTLRGNGSPRTLANNINLAVSGATIGGSSALTFNGTFTHTRAGASTLNITNSGGTTFTAINLSNSATGRAVTFAVTGDTFVTGTIANGGTAANSSLVKAGAGMLTLSGTNTYGGPTTLSAGTLRATNASALGTGSLALAGGTLELAGDSDTGFNRPTSLTASTTIKVDRLSTGAGITHTLGTLSSNNATLTVQPGSLLTANTAYGLTFGALTLVSTTTLNVANNGSATGTLTFGSFSNSANVGILLTGPGTVVFNAASGALTSGTPITINRGTLRLDFSNAIGASALANVTVNATTAGETALLDLNNNSQSILGLTFGGATATSTSTNNVTTGTGTLTLGGNVTYTATNNPLGSTLSGNLSLATSTRTFTIGDSTSAAIDLLASAAISGTGGIAKAGAGTLKLSGANTYSGGTALSAGTLILANNSALGSGTLTFNAASTLRGDGTPLTLANSIDLAITGATIGGSSALTFNSGTLTNTFAGNIALNITNTGGTTFNAVKLSNSTTSRIVTFATTGDAAITGIVANGGGSAASGLTKTGTGKLTLSGANTYRGATTLSAGTLRATTDPHALGAGPLSLGAGTLELAGDSGIAFTPGATTIAATTTIKIDRLTAGPGVTHSLGALTTGTFTLNVQPGALVDTNTPYGLTFGAVTLSGAPFTLNVANNGSATGTVTLGSLSNVAANGLTLTGPGIVLLNAASGTIASGTAIVVNRGTLRLGASNALGATALANVTVNELFGATALLDLNGFTQSILSINFGGTGALPTSFNTVATGAGTANLGGNVTASATGNPLGASLTGNVSLGAANRTFTVGDSINAPTDLLVSATLSGTGGLIKAGAGRLDLTAANTHSGANTLSAGTLGLGSNTALGTNSLTLTSGTLIAIGGPRTLANNLVFSSGAAIAFTGADSLTFNGTATLAGTDVLTNSTTVTLSGVVSGTGALSLTGGGSLTLLGSNTYSGGTTINGGILRASNTLGSATGTGAITLGAAGTLGGTGRVTGTITANGTLSPGGPAGSGPGTLATGAETWNGGAHYVWDLRNATGIAGTDWDKLSLTGNLTIAATNASRFVLDIVSLSALNAPGNAANFSGGLNYSWIIASVTGSISGFAANKFTISTAGFTNVAPGTFALVQSGTNLMLTYTAVPELELWGLALPAALFTVVLLRRRNA